MIRHVATKNLLVTVALVAVLITTSILYNEFGQQAGSRDENEVKVTQNIIGAIPESTTYRGNVPLGTTALSLLQQQAEVKIEGNSSIVEINGQLADQANRESWALYVNGKQADIAPEKYILQDSDIVEWKIIQTEL